MFINSTDIIGIIMMRATDTSTGSMIVTLLLVMIFLMVIAMMFQMPLELTAIVMLPYVLACTAYYSDMLAGVVVIIIYLGILATKHSFIK